MLNPFINYNKEFETTSDPDPEPDPNEQLVRCNRCKWEGKISRLKAINVVIPSPEPEAMADTACPCCWSPHWLEYKE